MTKDFKDISEPSSSTNQYGISWVLGGIAVGLLIGAVVYATASNQLGDLLHTTTNSSVTSEQTTTSPAAAPLTPPTANQQDRVINPRPSFSYHAVLPQLELDVPLAVINERPQRTPAVVTENPPVQLAAPMPVAAAPRPAPIAAAPRPTPIAAAPRPAPVAATPAPTASSTAITGSGRFMFQLGSYRNESQAQTVQRRAQQNGLNTRIESAIVNGETWHRVRLGPTNDLQVANRWKQMLSGMGISAMLIRM